MKKTFTIYHNPKCSKSREALELLRARKIEPEIIEYLKHPLDAKMLRKLVGMLGVDAHALLRTKEDSYKELGLSPSSPPDEIIGAIAKHPILLERPIVVSGDRAVIGRPPENVLGLVG